MTRAVLIIDVQREYFDGAFPICYPVGHFKNILEIMDRAAATGLHLALIRHHQPDPESPVFRLNSDMWQLHTDVEQRHHDILIDKQLPGAFTNTNLDEWLKSVGADTVSIAGYMTQVCCDTTARQAMHRGYKVEFLRDSTGTLPIENEAGAVSAEQMHTSILVAQQMFFSEVMTNKDWIARVESEST